MRTVIFRVQTKSHFLLYLWHIFKSLHNTEKKGLCYLFSANMSIVRFCLTEKISRVCARRLTV